MSLAAKGTGRPRPKLELRGRPVKLDADPAKVWPRWMQIAGTGLYLGHPSGPFDFNDQVFAEIIRNFRALPEYKPGSDGVGTARVIPYDWRHASEQSALDGGANAIAAQAAQGWIWDVQKRLLPDGTTGLFAFSEALEPAKSLIDEGKIAWTSVCVWPDSVDRVTGQKIGCYLSSVAWTNDPFVRGMVAVSTPLAAERYVDFYEIPKSAGDLVEALRALFGLSVQAPLAAVLQELTTLRACASGQMPAPPGVDVVQLVGALRRLFNLETIATAADVFGRCDRLLGAVAAEEALAEAAEPPSSRLPPITAAARRAARTTKDHHMDLAALLALLSGPLKCAATADAVATAFPLFFAKAEAEAKEGKGAKDKLGTLLTALGVQDPEAALDKISAQLQMSKQLLEAMPELAEMYSEKCTAEDEEAEGDIAMAASRLGSGPFAEEAKQGIFFARTGGIELIPLPKLENGKIDHRPLLDAGKRAQLFSALRSRMEARKKFRERLGADQPARPAGPPTHQSALFQRFAAEGGGDGGAGPMRGAGGRALEAGRRPDREREDPNAIEIDLSDTSSLPGENPGQRALAFVRQNKAKLGLRANCSFDDEHEAATELRDAWAEQTASQGHQVGDRF